MYNFAFRMLKTLPHITGLGITIDGQPEIDRRLKYAAAQLKLETLHVNKAALHASDLYRE